MSHMKTENLYQYNEKKKMINGLILLTLLFIGIVVLIGVYLFFNKLSFFKDTFIADFMSYVKLQISMKTLFGVFLLAAVGGLFFVPLPMEALYADFILKNPNTVFIIIFYMIGLIISYSVNLFIGYKFSNFSRKVISTKKFYEIKVKLNEYGKLGVFLVNLIPFFPSQQVSLILGVFKYNKTKFYVYFISGQFLKMVVITLFVLFSKKIF